MGRQEFGREGLDILSGDRAVAFQDSRGIDVKTEEDATHSPTHRGAVKRQTESSAEVVACATEFSGREGAMGEFINFAQDGLRTREGLL